MSDALPASWFGWRWHGGSSPADLRLSESRAQPLQPGQVLVRLPEELSYAAAAAFPCPARRC